MLNRQTFAGRDTRLMFVATVVAEASAVARGSANCGSALLIVNGSSGSSLFAQPNASEPVSCVRRANFA